MQLLEMGLVMQSKLSILESLGVILTVTVYYTLSRCQELCACYSLVNNSEIVTVIILMLWMKKWRLRKIE